MFKSTLVLIATIGITFVNTREKETIYFASLNHAIQEGQFDGVITVNELKGHGNFGLGSEEKLKGELVLLDGNFYSIPSTGKAALMRDENKIAFAAIKSFTADSTFSVKNLTDAKALYTYLDARIDQNSFVALKITGMFRTIEFRSFIQQNKPYKPVDQVPENKFRHENMQGTMVGFFTPKSAQVLNSPNYHFHFIDNGKKTGGHVLECTISSATVEVDYADELHVLLPPKKAVEQVDLNEPLQPKKEE
jgi:acetolactate decarboxylase